MNAVLPEVKAEFFQDGKPLAGGKVYFYEPGTTTPKNSYSDALGAVPNTNPVVLDSQGRATIFISGFYKVKVTTALGTELYTTDNVSASPFQALTVSEWITSGVTPTYISAVSFSVPGDYTGTFEVGRRVKAIVSAGTVYGTIITSSYGTGVTTVTVINDTGALDAGLASADTGILSLTNKAIPVEPVVTKTDDYVMTAADVNKQFIFNKGTAVATTLKAANAVPNGTRLKFKNVGAGTLTLTGTVILYGTSTVNPTLVQHAEAEIWSNGTSWYGVIWSAIPTANAVPVRDENARLPLDMTGEASAKNSSPVTITPGSYADIITLDLGTVTAGDKFYVSASSLIGATTVTAQGIQILKASGTATITAGVNRSNIISESSVGGGVNSPIFISGIFSVSVGGTLVIKQQTLATGTGTISVNTDNGQIYAFFLKKQ